MTDYYIIEDSTDASFCRVAESTTTASSMVSFFTNSDLHTGTYSYTTVSVTDPQLMHLYCHAACIDKANFELDATLFGGVSGT